MNNKALRGVENEPLKVNNRSTRGTSSNLCIVQKVCGVSAFVHVHHQTTYFCTFYSKYSKETCSTPSKILYCEMMRVKLVLMRSLLVFKMHLFDLKLLLLIISVFSFVLWSKSDISDAIFIT